MTLHHDGQMIYMKTVQINCLQPNSPSYNNTVSSLAVQQIHKSWDILSKYYTFLLFDIVWLEICE